MYRKPLRTGRAARSTFKAKAVASALGVATVVGALPAHAGDGSHLLAAGTAARAWVAGLARGPAPSVATPRDGTNNWLYGFRWEGEGGYSPTETNESAIAGFGVSIYTQLNYSVTPQTTLNPGPQPFGIYVTSIGGPGGSATVTTTQSLSSPPYVQNGAGGSGSNITITNTASLVINGTPAPQYGQPANIGIFAVSAGGAAGVATANGTGITMAADAPGGQAGNVAITHSADLAVGSSGNATGDVVGILAQSIGGAAGYGVENGKKNNTTVVPGTSGNAGTVTVDVSAGATLTLQGGAQQQAIVAQSIGGGSSTQYQGKSQSVGDIGNSNAVTVRNAASVTTSGRYGVGILAQSIGGGGGFTEIGYGSASTIGSANGTSNQVTVIHAGGATLGTTGNDAAAIVAQGLGDGGGLFTTADVPAGTKNPTLLALGASAAAGNNGGTVSVQLGCSAAQSASAGCAQGTGAITTQGQASFGVLAQSVAAGGGTAVGNGAIGRVGSSGTAGGSGGEVDVSMVGASSITTAGDGAIGIVAQSIGGGGGNGGSARGWSAAVGGTGGAGGTGGTVTLSLGAAGDTASQLGTSGDYAYGALAQSIGGGGGAGGYAKSVGLFASAAIGGTGGAGGTGGSASISNFATVQTSGAHSSGLIAQSIAGGGGTGGAATAHSVGVFISVAVALGGAGGSGGTAGAATIDHTGSVTTGGLDAMGIVAQSIAGGGGNGGTASSKAEAFAAADPELPTISIGVALGGSGGGGGNAGNARVNLRDGSTIKTSGDGAHGVLAQGIGGGGGNGGDSSAAATAGSFDTTAEVSVNLAFGLAGSGGSGGVGGTVIVDADQYTKSIATTGNGASAIVAQSIGGGGGNGGVGNSNTKDKTESKNYTLTLALGGSGGNGALGNQVEVAYSGQLTTAGSAARGVVAQSIGGGGGLAAGGTTASDGAAVTLAFSLGGKGGSGGDGGDVTVLNSLGATVATTGGYADAILAQSIGGGGGAAGNADNDGNSDESAAGSATGSSDSESESTKYGFAMSLGGGGGGNGGTVQIGNQNNSGFMHAQTSGVWSHGILAQSIGGGGGSAGMATSDGESGTYTLNVALGGGGGGDGGTVNVQDIGLVKTQGYGSMGIVAQSIGGGGGVGVDGSGVSLSSKSLKFNIDSPSAKGGTGGGVTVSLGSGSVSTGGTAAYGVVAQSIGGTGGLFGFGDGNTGSTVTSVASQLGSNAGVGAGGAVEIDVGTGSIVTTGVQAHGVLAQSIGGGGGAMAGAEDDPTQVGYAFNAHLGGGNEARGNGGTVTVGSIGLISTSGRSAMGVIAQSIGAGGGLFLGNAADFTATSVGGSSTTGTTGKGDTVQVNLGPNASISTSGAGAWGILAQSIGGGGGFIGDPTASDWQGTFSTQHALGTQGSIGAKGSTGDGGQVQINVERGAKVSTTGANAHAIVAQSVGGGGGIVSLAANSLVGSADDYQRSATVKDYAGNGGAVNVQVDGTVSATGSGAYGVFAQSAGIDNGVVTIDITGAVYGNAAGVAVANLASGSSVTIAAGATLAGGCTAASVASCTQSGFAILKMTKESSSLTVTNNGTVVGSLDPGTMSVAFANHGTFYAGREITNVAISDSGTTYIGTRAGVTSETVMTGVDYAYGPAARLIVDANFTSGRADLVRLVSSQWHSLAPAPEPLKVLLNSAYLMPKTPLTLLTQSTDSTVGTALPIAVESVSPAFSYDVARQATAQGTAYTIEAQANLTPEQVSLHRNEHALARYLQRVWDGGVATAEQKTLANTYARLAAADAASYEQVLSGMIATLPVTQAAAAPLAAQSFLFNMAGCASFTGTGVGLQEGPCAWTRVIGGESRVDPGETFGYERRFTSVQGGGQIALGNDWYVGGAVAYDDNRFQATEANETGDGHSLLVGVTVKRELGPWVLSGTVAGGTAWTDANRTFSLPGAGGLAPLVFATTSSNRTNFVDGKLRATYALPLRSGYLRPALDLDVLYVRMGGYSENGGGLYSLDVSSSSQTLFMATPSVEAGLRHDLDADATLRVYGALGFSVLSKDGFSAAAGFASVPGAGSFDITAPIPDAFGKAALGVELFRRGGLEARLQWNADFGDKYFGQAGALRIGYSF